MKPCAPYLRKPIGVRRIRQQQFFSFEIRSHFAPRDNSLRFKLLPPTPEWVAVDPVSGMISGTAPAVQYDKQFIIMVRVTNAYGFVEQSFHLKVTFTDLSNVQTHDLKKQFYLGRLPGPLSNDIPYRHELLEYIYEYFLHSVFKDQFLALIRQNADRLNMRLSEKINYHDFSSVIKALNPTVERDLKQRAKRDTNLAILISAELRDIEFHNLYRQGSQPSHAHPIPVWNYLGAASYHNWGYVRTVLNAAALELQERQFQNQKAHARKRTQRPRHQL